MKKAEVTFYFKDLPTVKIECEIADTFTKKMKGLMARENLPKDQGMLFTFMIPWQRFFWMKNVKIPLDIIFVNRKSEIIKIHEAPVETGIFYKMYSSRGLCKYVVEANMGFCKKNNIKVKDCVKIKK